MTYQSAFLTEGNRLVACGKVGSWQHNDFLFELEKLSARGVGDIVLDFTSCASAYHNGMLPILCTVDELRAKGVRFSLLLPIDQSFSRHFINCNWAHFLVPTEFPKSDSANRKHLSTQRFVDGPQQKAAVDDLLEVMLRTIKVSRVQLKALEWSLNEITDNVLNHSECVFGGYVQAVAHDDNVGFTVADSGIGILTSLKQGFPELADDETAVNLAV